MPDIFTKNAPSPNPPQGDLSTPPATQRNIFPLAAFSQNSGGIKIQGQKEEEHILLFLRAHPITNGPWILATAFLIIFPPLLSFAATILSFSFSIPPVYLLFITLFYYLGVIAYAFVNFITWFYNASLITTERIVDIDYSNLVYQNVAATKIDLVKDVEYTQSGFIRSFFDYGDVVIHTEIIEPGKELFDFIAVPKPAKVASIIENMLGRVGDV